MCRPLWQVTHRYDGPVEVLQHSHGHGLDCIVRVGHRVGPPVRPVLVYKTMKFWVALRLFFLHEDRSKAAVSLSACQRSMRPSRSIKHMHTPTTVDSGQVPLSSDYEINLPTNVLIWHVYCISRFVTRRRAADSFSGSTSLNESET